MAGLFEFPVQNPLHVLPDGIAVGTQNREALDRGVLHQFRFPADIRIPLSKINLHIGDLLDLFLFCHCIFILSGSKYCRTAYSTTFGWKMQL